jgi:hypothetical protein
MEKRKSLGRGGVKIEYPEGMSNTELAGILRELVIEVEHSPPEPTKKDPTSTVELRRVLKKKKDMGPS